MNIIKISPSSVRGNVSIPPSKSQSHRAIIFGAMAQGVTKISNLLISPDTERMIQAWKQLGASITYHDGVVTIIGLNGVIEKAPGVIDVGNSGITLRFLAALSALGKVPISITGDESLRQRPMSELMKGLRMLGADATSLDKVGFAPVKIQGPLKGGVARIKGQDSQPVSAMLIAAMFTEGETEIYVEDPGEIPWIKMTLDWFDRSSLNYLHKDYSYYRIKGKQPLQSFNYTVPGDWSSAAFPAAAALVSGGALTLEGLDPYDLQGDKRLFEIFAAMGASIHYDETTSSLKIEKEEPLKAIEVDLNDCIDSITILAAVACYAEGKTRIVNASVARTKECDRIHCIATELSKMGAKISVTDDGLVIEGTPLKGADLQSYGDHRMAMTLAIAALGAKGVSSVHDTACIAKTYPSFIGDMKALGAQYT